MKGISCKTALSVIFISNGFISRNFAGKWRERISANTTLCVGWSLVNIHVFGCCNLLHCSVANFAISHSVKIQEFSTTAVFSWNQILPKLNSWQHWTAVLCLINEMMLRTKWKVKMRQLQTNKLGLKDEKTHFLANFTLSLVNIFSVRVNLSLFHTVDLSSNFSWVWKITQFVSLY